MLDNRNFQGFGTERRKQLKNTIFVHELWTRKETKSNTSICFTIG